MNYQAACTAVGHPRVGLPAAGVQPRERAGSLCTSNLRKMRQFSSTNLMAESLLSDPSQGSGAAGTHIPD